MPRIVGDLRLGSGGLEPEAAVVTGIRKHRIIWFVRNQLTLFLQGGRRDNYSSAHCEPEIGSALSGLQEANDAAFEVNLRPLQRELLAPSHSGVNTEDEGWDLLPVIASDNGEQLLIFRLAQEPQSAIAFPSRSHEPRRVL